MAKKTKETVGTPEIEPAATTQETAGTPEIEPAATTQETAGTQEAATQNSETASETANQSGNDTEQQQDTVVDTQCETQAVAAKRLTADELKLIADNVLKKINADIIYVTIDGTCFVNKLYAEAHAATLQDAEVLTFN